MPMLCSKAIAAFGPAVLKRIHTSSRGPLFGS
jgi:hypothetical protein